jgi:hypothetical protein
MKTTYKQPKTIIDYAMWLHVKTSSWVAGMIGPMVFNYGTTDKNWDLSTQQLQGFPQGTLGKALGDFLQEHNVDILKGAEYHDIQHVLLGYSISFKDEVALQFFYMVTVKNHSLRLVHELVLGYYYRHNGNI